MTDQSSESSSSPAAPDLGDVMEPEDDALPDPIAQGHAGQPGRLDDDALDVATQQERVAAGVADYAPDDVPDATDPLPEGAAPEADFAQRDLSTDFRDDE